MLADCGDGEAAGQVLRRLGLDGPLPDTVNFYEARLAAGLVRVASGQVGEGIDQIRAVGHLWDAIGVRSPDLAPWRPHLAQALLLAGQKDEARAVADQHAALARTWGAHRLLARALRVQGLTRGGEDGTVLLRESVGDVCHVARFPDRDHFAACNGTAPIEVSSGGRKIWRLSRRGNRRHGHAIHMAAVTQIRRQHSQGHAYYHKKLAEGKTGKEALRALKRQVSDAIYACLPADARRAAAHLNSPGGQPGNGSDSTAAGSHPGHRLFGQATPGPSRHPTTAASNPAPAPASARGRAGHSPIAANPPPAPAAGPGAAPAAKRGRTTWRCGKTTATLIREEGHRPS
jgi:hypothetical protein